MTKTKKLYKCKECLKKFQLGLMSVKDDNICQNCFNYASKTQQQSISPINYRAVRYSNKIKSVKEFYSEKIDNIDSSDIRASKPQIEIANFLRKNGHEVEIEFPIRYGEKKSYSGMENLSISVDILLNRKIAVEFNGTYYHQDPRKYKEDNIFVDKKTGKKSTAKQIWDKDKKRHDIIKNFGYKLIVIWEDDYVSDKNKVLESLLRDADFQKEQNKKLIEEMNNKYLKQINNK